MAFVDLDSGPHVFEDVPEGQQSPGWRARGAPPVRSW